MVDGTESTKDDEEILTKLRDLDHKLDSLKKDKLADSEDQLFFGVIISFFILFVTLPISDLTNFLQNSFHFTLFSEAQQVAQAIRNIGIGLFLFSAITRYYAVVGNQKNNKTYRFLSLEAFILALVSMVSIIFINFTITMQITYRLSYNASIVCTFFLLSIILMTLSIVEHRFLKFYSNRALTFKRYTVPWSCGLVLSFVIPLLLINVGWVIARLFGDIPPITDIAGMLLILAIFIIIALAVYFAYFVIWDKQIARAKRKEHTTSKLSEK